MSAGYSGTPLPKKLGIVAGTAFATKHAPAGFAGTLGALPLAIGFGEGSELRQPLGIAIIGGLVASQVLTLLTTPVVYVLLDRLSSRKRTVPVLQGAPA